MSIKISFMRKLPNDSKSIKTICLLALVLFMVLFIKNAKDYGVFCGAVAILNAILDDKESVKK